MADVCLVFLLHHPERLRHVRAFDDSLDFGNYVDPKQTHDSLRAAASRSFLPALKLLREAIDRSHGRVRIGLCPTGPFLRAAQEHHAALMNSLRKLNETGAVEWICSPADGSILSIFPGDHVARQLEEQSGLIQRLFGARPTTAANTEMIYDNAFARQAAAAGMKLVLCGHADRQLNGRTANRVYRAAGDAPVKVLARHAGLSDDWGVRFSDESWACCPLKPETYADWIAAGLASSGGSVCPIMLHLMDLGLTHPKESGIFSFSRRLLTLLVRRGMSFLTPAQAAERAGPLQKLDVLDVPQATSGHGPRFDLSPWLGNAMQSNALHLMREAIKALAAESGDGASGRNDGLRRLCAADHLIAMRHLPPGNGGQSAADAEARRRPVTFESPYDAYLDHTNALRHALKRP